MLHAEELARSMCLLAEADNADPCEHWLQALQIREVLVCGIFGANRKRVLPKPSDVSPAQGVCLGGVRGGDLYLRGRGRRQARRRSTATLAPMQGDVISRRRPPESIMFPP
jgi:hypothetical protein